MDTVERAAGLADSRVADAVNKEWLLESGRSSQASNDLRARQAKLETKQHLEEGSCSQWHYGSTESSGAYSGCTSHLLSNATTGAGGGRRQAANETSWLMHHYAPVARRLLPARNRHATVAAPPTKQQEYSINGHLYDNISFSADAPILSSLSSDRLKTTDDELASGCQATGGKRASSRIRLLFVDKFRIFLACYLLLGITLAIYSRNALSLAAVGMVASNAVNVELVELLARPPTSAAYREDGQLLASNLTRKTIQFALDGSCPVMTGAVSNNVALPTTLYPSNTMTAAASEMGGQPFLLNNQQQQQEQQRQQIEIRFRESVRRRIESGELIDWSPTQQGLIFAAGSVGNLLIAIPLTRLGEIYGAKWIILCASLGASLQAALMPIISPCPMVVVLTFQLIFNGLTYGADCVAYTLFAHWLAPTEMAFFVSCLLICYQLGTILSSFITAQILARGIAWSWCFYVPAILCGIWTLIWAFIGASEPSKSAIISRAELLFLTHNSKIAKNLNEQQQQRGSDTNAKCDNQQQQVVNRQHSLSWWKLARDPNIWAIVAVKFTMRWYFSVYLSLMPTFLSSVAHMSISTIGRMSVFQSFVGLFLGVLMGFLTKSLVTKRPLNMSLATTRKCFQSIVNFGLSLSLLAFIIYDCNQWVTIVALTLGGVCVNFYVAAALQLPLDLSPEHCGLITSITNTLALGQAIGAPISGLILEAGGGGSKDRASWRIVWAIAIVLNTLSGLGFIALVDSKPRSYDSQPRI